MSGTLHHVSCARRALLLVAGLILLSAQAQADDFSNGVMLPGMQSTPAGSVRVTSGRIVLRDDQVAVSVTTEVPSGSIGHVVIHGSRFGWLGEGETYPDRQFPELRASLDGTRVTVTSSFSAFVGSTDISASLRDAQLDPFVIAQTPPFVSAVSGHETAFNKLVAQGAIQKSDDGNLAQWDAARDIGMTLGKNSRHTLALTYTARPAYALVPFNRLGATVPLASYCLSKADVAQIRGYSATDRPLVVRQYAVPVGLDGKPVAAVQVSVTASGKSDSHHALVVFCGADGNATIGRTSDVSAAAQTDSKGVMHILTISGNPM